VRSIHAALAGGAVALAALAALRDLARPAAEVAGPPPAEARRVDEPPSRGRHASSPPAPPTATTPAAPPASADRSRPRTPNGADSAAVEGATPKAPKPAPAWQSAGGCLAP
jgi:hypothetical protein